MTLLNGTSGWLKMGPTNALTLIGKISQISLETTSEITAKGPWLGENTIEKTQAPRTSSGSFTCDIPAGHDVGQKKYVELSEANTGFRLEAQVGDGSNAYEYVAASVGVETNTIEGDPKTGWTIQSKFQDMTGYTLVPSA